MLFISSFPSAAREIHSAYTRGHVHEKVSRDTFDHGEHGKGKSSQPHE
jgi:hypothetical protein